MEEFFTDYWSERMMKYCLKLLPRIASYSKLANIIYMLNVDPDFSFKSMLESTDLLAYYDSVDSVVESKEFKTCLVSIETCLGIFFLDFFKLKCL